jgi:large repetitive protein
MLLLVASEKSAVVDSIALDDSIQNPTSVRYDGRTYWLERPVRNTTKQRIVSSSLAIVVFSACQSQVSPSDPNEDSPVVLTATPPTDLGSSVSVSDLAFVPHGAGFRAGYKTHDVVVVDGHVTITPKSLDETGQHWVEGGSLGIQTTSVVRGDQPLGLSAGDTSMISPTKLSIPYGNVVETVTNAPEGIEQSWEFSAKPAGIGDLEIVVAASGQTFVTSNERGLHFSSDQGLGFNYSHGVWRDATGEAWDVPARYENEQIHLTVPRDLLDGSTYPAVLDPTVSAELFTDVPAIGSTGATSMSGDVTSNGSEYFVVWQDQRHDRNYDIYGTRVTSEGAVSDTGGIKIRIATGLQQNPVVAWVGNGYLVAWEDVVTASNTDIHAAFVSTSGTVTQLGGIAATAANETAPRIAGRGSEALVVWSSGGTDVYGAMYSAGAFQGSFALAAGVNTEKEHAVAADPAGSYLVTFTETVVSNNNVRGQLVGSTGALQGAAFNVTATMAQESQSDVTFDGTNFVVVWSTNDIRGARVSATGTVLDTTALVINNNTAGAQLLPRVSCTAASGCMVIWQDNRAYPTQVNDVYGAATTNALAVVTNDIVIASLPRQQMGPRIALAAGQYLGIWNDNRNVDTTDIRGTRFDSAGTILDPTNLVVVTNTSNAQAPAMVQSTNSSYPYTDVYWSESQIPDNNIIHARFSNSGLQADNPPKTVSNALNGQLQVAAAFVGTNSMAVWSDLRNADRDIYAARVNIATGVVIDSAGIQITNGNGDQVVPKVASAGTTALAVWQDRRGNATTGFDVYGALIDSNGTVTVTDISICAGVGDETRPSVTFDSVNQVYIVVWTTPGFDINGARVSTAGTVLDGGCGVTISSATNSQFSADVAAGSNGQSLVVWQDRRNSATLGDIYGSRITTNGSLAVVDPAGIPIAQVANSAQAEPSVAFGTSYGSYLVVWTDSRNAATASDVYASQVSPAGVAAANFVISAGVESEAAPIVRRGPPGSPKPFTVAYNKHNNSLDADRLQVRQVALGTSQGQSCTQASQCESGFCVDFKCCSSACGGGDTTDCQACSLQRYGTIDGTCTTIPAAPMYTCRMYVDSYCDIRETCDGVSTTCGPDLGQHAGKVCNTATQAVCPAATSGTPHRCP